MSLREYHLFFSQFRQRFHWTGAIAPSSAALARAMTAPLRQAGPGPRRVLEAGPGTGVFTRAILAELGAGDQLDICEINPAFEPVIEACLRQSGARARGVVCQVHICNIRALAAPAAAYDFIVSGLPLNNFPAAEVEAILAHLVAALRPGGVLSYFEYIAIRDLKRALVLDAAERARLAAVEAVVARFLGERRHDRRPVLLNLPPAYARHVYRA